MNFKARYLYKGKSYAMEFQAKDHAEARARCRATGWELEEDAARRNASDTKQTEDPRVNYA